MEKKNAQSVRPGPPSGLQIEVHTSEAGVQRCMNLRMTVFVEEQNVPVHEEIDDLDSVCTHFIARLHDDDVGTARLWKNAKGEAKAQRVAVLKQHRGKGIGAALMVALEKVAIEHGHQDVVLGAQLEALAFYERIGYAAYGPVFDDAGIPHRMMKKTLG